MAKRKRSKSYRRRRMGATGGVDLMGSIAVIAGAAAARLLTGERILPNLNPNIKNAGVIAIGALAMPRIIKGGIGKSLGDGMVAAGGIGLLSNLGVLAGDDLSVLAGDDMVMAGDDMVMAGDGDGIADSNLSVIGALDELDSY